jgi:hypothetical protein
VKYFGDAMSERHKELNKIIRKKDRLDDAKRLFAELHGELNAEADALFGDLSPREYRVMPTAKDETIAWAIWHLTRIEDLTVNILIADTEQIFDERWEEKLNAGITDTGNALSDDEIMQLSRDLNCGELLAYRKAVVRRTQSVVRGLSYDDMRRRVSPRGIEKIRASGGVTGQEESVWLLDYWGKKDAAGILLMPPTRHTMLHLGDCFAWREHLRAGKKVFRE